MFKGLLVAALMIPGLAFAANDKAAIQNDMQVIASTYDKLGTQIDDKTKNADSQKLVDTMLEKSQNAMKQTPRAASKAIGPVKEKIIASYKTQMQTMIEHLNGVKTALQANNNAEARKHFDALKPWTKPEHKTEFQ